jgi:hypothetical protein
VLQPYKQVNAEYTKMELIQSKEINTSATVKQPSNLIVQMDGLEQKL